MRLLILGFTICISLVGCFRFEDYRQEDAMLSGKWQLSRILSTAVDSAFNDGATIEFLNEEDFKIDFKNGTVEVRQYLYRGGERLLLGNVLHFVYKFSDEKLTVSGAPILPFEGEGKLSYFERIE